MGKYKKVIAAAIGLAAIVGRDLIGIDVDDETVSKLIDSILGTGTAIAVYRAANAPSD